MNDSSQRSSIPSGIGLDDLPLVYRALFDHAVRAATDLHDPAREPQAFVEALWTALARTLEWTPDPWPEELPRPRLNQPPPGPEPIR